MQLHAEILTVTTRHPFIIARGGQSSYRTVFVRLVDNDGAEGWGEAAPSRYYGETADSALLAVQQFAPVLANADAWSLDAIERELEKTLRGNAAARCAVSAALHDLAARRLAVPLWKYWGLDRSAAPRSSFTIGIAPDEATLRARVREAAHYPILKIKLGSHWDREVLRIVREEAPRAQLRVDANAAWTAKQALSMLDALHDVGVDMLEQPLPPQDLAGLRFVRDRAAIAVVADESCLVASDIPKLAGVVDGVNIKLAKCGSLREALRMIAVARAHDMRVMCGCMIETTLGIAAAAHFSPLLDDADLDGAALLSDDPFDGPGIPNGQVTLGDAPGLGVTRR
ncbi:dipeptide epimerase [Gemmatimonas sp. UBA7669]|uniref:dipeptide epimerase n=1 Tax=Gemmatimonas sp. UBA7669 TaxID=1946568 RepID=UPI0025BEB577|nr:dipeptide epimerase [Gemmatimonas sp. UBA7669]